MIAGIVGKMGRRVLRLSFGRRRGGRSDVELIGVVGEVSQRVWRLRSDRRRGGEVGY